MAAPRSVTKPSSSKLVELLTHAVRAPSVLNTQPWSFVVNDGAIEVWADRSRQLPALDPQGRELTISCGAAVLYLRIAAQHDGWEPSVDVFPAPSEPDHLATVRFRPGPRPPGDDRLFRALAMRRTNRQACHPRPIAFGVSSELADAASAEGARLHVLSKPAHKAALGELVAEGVLAQGADAAVATELKAWLRPPGDPRPDGVADAAQGLWDRHASFHTPVAHIAPRKAALVSESPAVMVLSTPTDTPTDWLRAGQALARVLVVGADRGLAASYANEPVEVAPLRARLAELIDVGVPQLVFRMGYPLPHAHSKRRYAHDITDVVDGSRSGG